MDCADATSGGHAAWVSGIALLAVFLVAGPVFAQREARGELLDRRLAEPLGPHPRLFLSEARLEAVRQRIEEDPLTRQLWESIRREADAMLVQAPSTRNQVGLRLLGVSRTVLKRVSYLSFTHRITGEERYLRRAEAEMLAAAAFSDWNPSHFLDVAEMTAALAIGYDWLHDGLGEQSRATIRSAIIRHGLQPGQRGGWWVTTTNNWSQVCHAGLTMGALVVMEEAPELSRATIRRGVEHIHRPMDVYGPSGAYPEGPGYWAYGTSFNVMLLDALHTALGTDLGLAEHPRFMASANYYLHMHGPTLRSFNYSDNSEGSSLEPAAFWFAARLQQPELLWVERQKLQRHVRNPRASGGRLLPLLLLWSPPLEEPAPPRSLGYRDDGSTPVATLRSGWGPDSVYVGLKAGRPDVPHGQMDIGTFVMEADGVRWAIDLGMQDYHSLESRGFRLWNMAQDSDRWRAFRLNNLSKNTLVVDGRHQRVDGLAPITAFSDRPGRSYAVIDMSRTYAGQLAGARRGVRLLDDRGVLIQDEIRAAGQPAEVRWGMMTRAEVQIVEPTQAILRQDGRQLGLRVLSPAGATLRVEDTAAPPQPHDAPNPGTRMVVFEVPLEPGQSQRLTVVLERRGVALPQPPVEPLDAWGSQ